MLSRVAENIYWLARYLERAENTARLLIATNHALLDAPRRETTAGGSQSQSDSGSQHQQDTYSTQGADWSTLITISGGQEQFNQSGRVATEATVMDFMARDRDNPNSIISSLFFARENLRTTRDAFPRKAMEYLNAMYLNFKNRTEKPIKNEGIFYKTLDQVIQDSQKITGLLFSTMSQDSAFEFFRLGQILERADMTTRILDVGASGMQGIEKDSSYMAFVNSLWLNILRSLSGEQMYRHHINPRIRWDRVVVFLLMDEQFPRAFSCCLNTAVSKLENLENHDAPLEALQSIISTLQTADLEQILQENSLPVFLDTLQIGLVKLYTETARTFFPTSPE